MAILRRPFRGNAPAMLEDWFLNLPAAKMRESVYRAPICENGDGGRRPRTLQHQEASLSFSRPLWAWGLAVAEPARGSSAEAPNLFKSRFMYIRKR